ncbi:MAG: ComF family protein [Clostridia bacterium]|nr:ComF family protein [Clostridia bacterium]
MNRSLSDVLRRVRFAFYPRRCALCGDLVEPQTEICGRCMQDLPRVPQPICFCCGSGKRECTCEKHHSPYAAAFAAPFYYTGGISRGIFRMKFRSSPQSAEMFGREMAAFARQVYPDVTIDLVTFVPMTRRERRERGYNQSELLARYTARELMLPMEPTLKKLYETARQRTLGKRERSGNVLGVFEAVDPAQIRGKRILLCDDLRTTGATMIECAKMLRIRGACEVLCLTAAVGLPKDKPKKKEESS